MKSIKCRLGLHSLGPTKVNGLLDDGEYYLYLLLTKCLSCGYQIRDWYTEDKRTDDISSDDVVLENEK